MDGFIVSSTVVQTRKGAIAEVAWVTFAGGNDNCAGVGAVGRGAVWGVASAARTGGVCRRRGGRVHDVLWIWGHVIIGFDARPRTCRRGRWGRRINLVRLRGGWDKLVGEMSVLPTCLLV